LADPVTPLVSCIITFLNEERYLAEAIDSVLAQSWGNWELLLVDDGSSDASAEIAMGYTRQSDGRIRYLTHPAGENRGMSASRNLGIAEAKGDFIAFLDGDDSWLPNKLGRQIDLFGEHPEALMVCGATLYWHQWQDGEGTDRLVRTGEILRGADAGVCLVEQDRSYRPPELMTLLYPLGRGVTPSMSGIIVRRSLFDMVGGFEDEFRGLFEDQVFRAKAYLAGPIYVAGECFDRYRQHEASCWQMTRSSPAALQARRRYLAWLTAYLDAVRCRDRRIRTQLRRLLWRDRYPTLYRSIRRLRAASALFSRTAVARSSSSRP
jgi:glycosyltransferase involved in cell wall biosynthesis